MRQHPDGIGARYIAEDRLAQEIGRSAKKFAKDALPAFAGFAPIATPAAKPTPPPPRARAPSPAASVRPPERQAPRDPDDDLPDPDDLLEDPVEGKPAAETTQLPELFAYGGKAGRQAAKSWLLKALIPQVGHGLLSGQWGQFQNVRRARDRRLDHVRRTFPRAPGETEIRRAPDRGRRIGRSQAAA